MTTKVRVMNEGPDNVTVTAVDKDGRQMAPLTLVKPGEFRDQYVHTNQELVIREIK